VIISASEDHAIEFLNRVYFILDRLPAWLYPPVKTHTKMILEFQHKETVSTIKSMPTIEMGAESKTPNLLIIDEAHTIREVARIFNSSYPGIEQARGQVIVIANSVKSGPGWPFVRDLYLDSILGKNEFTRIFLPWNAHPGRPTDFRERMERAGMSHEDVIWHYPETEDEAISAIASSYFGDALSRHVTPQIVALRSNSKSVKGIFVRDKNKEVQFIPKDNGIVELWRHPYFLNTKWDQYYWERRYCGGADVSEGQGASDSVCYIMDRVIDEFVCKIRSNRISAHEFAQILAMASEYYERAILCVERTGAGQTTVKILDELKANQTVRITSGKTGSGVTKELGWHESHQAKHELCNDLRQWLKTMKGTIWDGELIGQCQTWIEDELGKLGPEEGKYGDHVMAAGCTIQAHLYQGNVQKIIPPEDGWLSRLQVEKSGGSVWAA
jgi:hypothetical protein